MSNWALFPDMVVRTTGFPFELLRPLQSRAALEIARRIWEAHQQLQKIRTTGARLKRPTPSVLAALKQGLPVPLDATEDPERFSEWNRTAQEAMTLKQELAVAVDRCQQEGNQLLHALMNDARFREVLASSSPPVFQDVVRGRWSTRLERQLASYVQRLCAKNETVSFFGPINYGRCEFEGPSGVSVRWSGPEHLKARRTHLASWIIQGLTEKIAFSPDIAPWLVLRRKAFLNVPQPPRPRRLGEILMRMRLLTEQQLHELLSAQPMRGKPLGELLVDQRICTPTQVEQALRIQASDRERLAEDPDPGVDRELLAKVVSAADGSRPLRVLANSLRLPLPDVAAIARYGCKRGLLTHQLEVPSASFHPLADLIEHISGIPGEAARSHLSALGRVTDLVEQYGAADASRKVHLNDQLNRLFQNWGITTDEQAPVASGRTQERRGEDHHFYVDRLPMREECCGDLEVVVSGERAREIRGRMEPLLDCLAAAACRTQRAARRKLAQLLGERTAPLWKVAAAFSSQAIEYDTALQDMVSQGVADASLPRITLSSLPRSNEDIDGVPVVCSIDVLIAAESERAWSDGRYQLVVGDVHDTVLVWGWALQFHPERELVESRMVRALGELPRRVPVVTMLASRRTGLIPAELPGPVVELGSVSSRPAAWHVPFDDLTVVSDGKSVRLWSESLASDVYLYNGELESLVHTAFSLPRIRPARVDLGAHTPRLTYEGLVLQREQWRLTSEDTQKLVKAHTDMERLQAAAAIWIERGIPDVVFAKLEGERKPVLVDVSSPLLLRVVAALMQRRGAAVLSEMLPDPSQLWLKGPLGRHTAELRCTFLRTGQA